MAGEPALRRSSYSVHPPCMSEGDHHGPAALPPHIHYRPAHLTPRCAHSPWPQIILMFLPPPEVPPVVYHVSVLPRPVHHSSKQLIPLMLTFNNP